jgi:hypothetical protein
VIASARRTGPAGDRPPTPDRRGTRAAVALAVAFLLAPGGAPAAPREPGRFSHAAFDTVLRRFVRAGRVNYAGLRGARGPLDRYLAALAEARPDDWPREQQIAFWVNAYNAHVLDGVARRPGLKSVMDVEPRDASPPTFFAERFRLAGAERTLDEIENGILRIRYHEPRIHFVLNCAAVSCPELPGRALTGDRLEDDLEAATRGFLADRRRNRVEHGRELWLSPIFDWYAEDFRASAGSVPAFIARHWPGPDRLPPGIPVRILPYDWSLNARE